MKYTWKPKDIRAGTYVQAGSTDGITGTYIVGYAADMESAKHWRLISLADGMVSGPDQFFEKPLMCQHLNKEGFRPLDSQAIKKFLVQHVKEEHGS